VTGRWVTVKELRTEILFPRKPWSLSDSDIKAAANEAKRRTGPAGPGRGHKGYWKTECVHGHPFSEENTIITKRGKRVCRICKNATARAAWKKKGAKT
jgi:hypothetical protein